MDNLDFLQMPIKDNAIPLNLLTIGSNKQPHLNRPVGLPYHQIFLNTKGKGVFRIFGVGDFELLPGEVMLILKGTSHEYFPMPNTEWDLSFVGFDGELADDLLSHLSLKEGKKPFIHASPVIRKHIKQLWLIAKKNENTVQWRTSERMYSLLLELKRLSKLEDERNFHGDNPQNEHIYKVAEFIRTHYSRQLTIASLSNKAGYSPHHFTRLFKKIYNLTPHQYIVDIRLEKSKFLLEHKMDLHISEVAEQVGMEENYFIRLFRKKYGMTPGSYREVFSLDTVKNQSKS